MSSGEAAYRWGGVETGGFRPPPRESAGPPAARLPADGRAGAARCRRARVVPCVRRRRRRARCPSGGRRSRSGPRCAPANSRAIADSVDRGDSNPRSWTTTRRSNRLSYSHRRGVLSSPRLARASRGSGVTYGRAEQEHPDMRRAFAGRRRRVSALWAARRAARGGMAEPVRRGSTASASGRGASSGRFSSVVRPSRFAWARSCVRSWRIGGGLGAIRVAKIRRLPRRDASRTRRSWGRLRGFEPPTFLDHNPGGWLCRSSTPASSAAGRTSGRRGVAPRHHEPPTGPRRSAPRRFADAWEDTYNQGRL